MYKEAQQLYAASMAQKEYTRTDMAAPKVVYSNGNTQGLEL